ncbi:WxcM-like domain-containing protein [Polynucleobacter sp. UK-Kesae-W10]|uniref:WxcM-like domain-containing protein n=1 Tax=Polynucleobacter sp. UK-Kesae-W10 TaxID=1819738 RepID=UPI001C0E3866|nr:WxcM-like domain-containing protein [Polynucleobacter sp. UK-Kesae-W10]MBU3576956.1 WxcM-like domain-containing protein [Polynucleobacter sp. UK-Kesae-W10]
MDSISLKPSFTKLIPISHPKGDLFKILQKSSEQYLGFGEAYFTSINNGETKGWKRHKAMYLNLTVPIGAVRFNVLNDENGEQQVYLLGKENYGRLFIPPGFWVAFTGMGDGFNLVLNIASVEHDPNESENRELKDFPLQL